MQKNAVIANGTALAPAVDLGVAARLKAIQMPAGWDAAALTFQVSVDDVTYMNAFASAGEVSLTVALGNMIVLTFDQVTFFSRFRYVKVRSGTTGTPVNQTAQRTLVLHADDK